MEPLEYNPPKRYWARKESIPFLFPVDVVKESTTSLWLASTKKPVRKSKLVLQTFETFEQARDALIEETKTLADRRLALLDSLTPEDCTR